MGLIVAATINWLRSIAVEFGTILGAILGATSGILFVLYIWIIQPLIKFCRIKKEVKNRKIEVNRRESEYISRKSIFKQIIQKYS